jgi:branched-chain amino acid transport system permease protein
VLIAGLAAVPLGLYFAGNAFWLDIFTRLVILAIAACGLNLILGLGGLVSFGHAAYIGLGAYAVGVPAYHATYGGMDALASYNGFVHLGITLVVCAAFALITGMISLRTRGVNFIMITMAFGQMMFYAIVSIETYGGDDGLTIDLRSEFPLVNLDNPVTLYAVCYLSLLALVYMLHRIRHSRFGLTLQGTKFNEERMRALGVDCHKYQLTAFVLSGVICGYAGFLLGNFTTFISPEMMDWTRSGEIMFMVILGGAATLWGPVIGATVFIILEFFLSEITVYWHLPFGLLLIFSVLFLKGGISGALQQRFNRSTSPRAPLSGE